MEIFGPEASGKTTLALHVIAEAQKQGGWLFLEILIFNIFSDQFAWLRLLIEFVLNCLH